MGSGGMSSGLGRGSYGAFGATTTSTSPQQQAQQPQIVSQPPKIVATVQQANTANNATFSATDTQDFHDLATGGRNYYMSQTFDIDTRVSIQNYLESNTEAGSLYSMSQNLNYNMAHGIPLTPNQQYVHDGLMEGMHNLGQNLNLYRYDHPGFVNNLLNNVGLNGNYQNYSDTQLKAALVGTQFGENKFLSTSYNDFRHAPSSNPFTDRAVKITYKAKADTQALMPGNGKGGQLGEVILAPSNGANMKIVDVRYTGKMARTQGTQSYNSKQIELVIEVG